MFPRGDKNHFSTPAICSTSRLSLHFSLQSLLETIHPPEQHKTTIKTSPAIILVIETNDSGVVRLIWCVGLLFW
jgi:hypothetical protein